MKPNKEYETAGMLLIVCLCFFRSVYLLMNIVISPSLPPALSHPSSHPPSYPPHTSIFFPPPLPSTHPTPPFTPTSFTTIPFLHPRLVCFFCSVRVPFFFVSYFSFSLHSPPAFLLLYFSSPLVPPLSALLTAHIQQIIILCKTRLIIQQPAHRTGHTSPKPYLHMAPKPIPLQSSAVYVQRSCRSC